MTITQPSSTSRLASTVHAATAKVTCSLVLADEVDRRVDRRHSIRSRSQALDREKVDSARGSACPPCSPMISAIMVIESGSEVKIVRSARGG
jgi:hypothetical protein